MINQPLQNVKQQLPPHPHPLFGVTPHNMTGEIEVLCGSNGYDPELLRRGFIFSESKNTKLKGGGHYTGSRSKA